MACWSGFTAFRRNNICVSGGGISMTDLGFLIEKINRRITQLDQQLNGIAPRPYGIDDLNILGRMSELKAILRIINRMN